MKTNEVIECYQENFTDPVKLDTVLLGYNIHFFKDVLT